MPKTSARPFSGLITNEGLTMPSGMDQKLLMAATSSRGAPRRATNQPRKKPWTTASTTSPNQKQRNRRNVVLYELEPFAELTGSILSGDPNKLTTSGTTWVKQKARMGSQSNAAYVLRPIYPTTTRLATKPSTKPSNKGIDEKPIVTPQWGQSTGAFLRSSRVKNAWQAGHVH